MWRCWWQQTTIPPASGRFATRTAGVAWSADRVKVPPSRDQVPSAMGPNGTVSTTPRGGKGVVTRRCAVANIITHNREAEHEAEHQALASQVACLETVADAIGGELLPLETLRSDEITRAVKPATMRDVPGHTRWSSVRSSTLGASPAGCTGSYLDGEAVGSWKLAVGATVWEI